ncbi:MAG: hypothetical protein ACE5JJ_12135, partial [Nitrospinota bacterium]
AGEGLSQGVGVGGRDLSEEVGGLMSRAALEALARDEGTELAVVLSKTPSPAVAGRLLGELGALGKPAVCCLLGGADSSLREGKISITRSLGEAAERALELLGHPPGCLSDDLREGPEVLEPILEGLPRERRELRGLFSGGTLCEEAALLAREAGLDVVSNTRAPGVRPLAGVELPPGHLLLDLGDDRFTVGKPHPILDPAERARRLREEAARATTGFILLDVVLGYGAHEDPAGELAPAIEEARAGGAAVVVSLIGTEGDPQSLSAQREKLKRAGAVVFSRNDRAARAAVALAKRDLSFLGRGTAGG